MTGYIVRRILQMLLVVLISAAASYALLSFAPGGPLTGLRQMAQGSRFRITEEDIARIRAYYEMDLSLPIRFSRWLVGEPRGPITLFGHEFLSDLKVGCSKEVTTTYKTSSGRYFDKTECTQYVTLQGLVGRRTSRGILLGDFGLSWRILRDRPVSMLITSRLPKTVELMSISTILALLIGVPIGIYSAVKQYSRFDYIFTSVAFMGSAMPTFFFGILMILGFSVLPKMAGLPYLPPGSSEAVRSYVIPWFGRVEAAGAVDKILHLILPVAVLTFFSVSTWSRYVRASMLEVLRQDYIRTARAKGLVERVVIIKHALRNALIPFVTIVVFSIPAMFGGAIITETVFSWPGMGRLYFLALGEYDYPLAMAVLFITAVLTVIATLLRDILYMVVDPRIRFS